MRMGGNKPPADPPATTEKTDTEIPVDKAPEQPRPRAKSSPIVRVGETVIYRTQDKAKQFNGSSDHPAIVTHDFGSCVNLKVLPDCGDVYDATSQPRISADDEKGTGWFSLGEKSCRATPAPRTPEKSPATE